MIGRILGAAIVLAVTGMALTVAWPQLFGLQRTTPFAQLVALRGAAAAIAFAVLVFFTLIALLSRRSRRFFASLAVILLAFVALNALVIASRGIGNPAMPTPADSDVTVLAWNTLGDAPSAAALAELIADTGAEVVALPETTWEFGDEVVQNLATRGIQMQQFTTAYDRISKARSTTLLVSYELGEYRADLGAETTSWLPSVVATPVSGRGPTLVAVHAVAPIPQELPSWEADLKWIAAQCAAPNVIVAGDTNSTVDHWAGLADTPDSAIGNCRDAALETGNGAVGTWPTVIPMLAGAPIDHVLTGADWLTTGFRVIGSHDGYGSDHRPVLAQLRQKAQS